MGYKVKWVEEHLGVSRKALRGFEKAGLMPKNVDRQYRDYDDDDLDQIWAIRVLQGIGFSLKEIAAFISNDCSNWDEMLDLKIDALEKSKRDVEVHLGYAKMIKFMGRFPSRPAKMGEMKFDDFQKQALDGWNIESNPEVAEFQKLGETLLTMTPEEFEETDLGRMIVALKKLLSVDTDILLASYVLPKEIIKRMSLGASHPEIQLMIKMLYDQVVALDQADIMTPVQFARFYSSSYISGDIGKLNQNNFSECECLFLAEATAIFGGFESYDALLEEEAQYGRRKEESC